MDQCWTLYSNQWRTGMPVGDRSELDAAVAHFNATVEKLGPVVSVFPATGAILDTAISVSFFFIAGSGVTAG